MNPSTDHAPTEDYAPESDVQGLEVAPPRAATPKPPIPGQARLDEAVGKAVGGTVIPSDIKPSDMPSSSKLDAEKAEKPVEEQPQSQALPKSTEEKQAEEKENGDLKKKTGVKGKVEDLKKRTVGAYPTMTRIGWLEAYKRTDGPQNEFRDKSIWMEEFASSALFGAFWHNAVAVIVIPIVCFVVFKLKGGFVSLILIIAFGATYYKNSIRRFRRNARDDITRELIRNSLENDAESTEWINNFLSKFWLIYEPVLSSTVVQTVDGILVDSTPAFLDSIRLSSFTLGTKAPRVESVKAFPKSDPDVVVMDWKVSFTPTDTEDMTPRQLRTQINPKVCLTVRVGKGFVGAGMPILVEDMSFQGYMRIKLKLTSNFPHIKTLDISFLEPPVIDYMLKPVGGETFGMDIAHIPGLQSFIRDQTHAVLGPMMYAPNVYTLDLEQMMTGGSSLTSAMGVIQFTIYNAKDLKNSELVGNSDPYVKLRLGNRPDMAETAVQKDTLNPVWNETNIILINNLNEVVCMEIMDKDNLRKDRPLGQANFDLKTLEEDPVQDDVWCKVLRNGKERGAVRVRAAFFPVQVPKPSEDGGEEIPVESNSGILAINLAQAKDIARTGKTKSLCQVSLNGKVVHETKKMSGASPAWGANIDVFVTDLESAQISFEIISDDRVIGSYGVAASKLLKDTKEKVDWLSLKGGEGAGKIKMTGVWKPILMGSDMNPSVHKPAFGVMRVQLFAARNLRNVELGSSSDPYVVIMGDKGTSRGCTKTVSNNLNPVWNEIHYVPVSSMKQTFQLETFDYQKVTKDRGLGMTSFQVSEIVEELADDAGYSARPAVDRWAPLTQKDGSSKGELHYEISFFPSLKLAQEATALEGKAAPAETTNTTESTPEANTNPTQHQIEAPATTLPPNTIYARDALEHDSGILVAHLISANLDRAGTYCEFYVDSDSYQFKSQLQRSRSPKWNEVADIFVKELEYAKLIILVKEKSSLDKDPIIGNFTCNIRKLLEETPAEGTDFDLLDRNDERGSIRLKFEYLPVPIQLFPKERLDNMGNLTINLVGAKDLMAADRGGSSDPYMIFKVNGKEIFKSDVVKKNLSPVYNETFVVPIASRQDDVLSFEVLDWNQISTSKSLGSATIDLRNLQLVLPNEFMIPLQNKHNQGKVQLRLRFVPEFLSSNKRKSGFGATFIGSGVGAVANGGQMIGQAGMAGVGAVADGVGLLGNGAKDVTGAVGKGAVRGVGTVGKGVGRGVGTVGKGVFGGISAGASAIGLHKRSDKSESSNPMDPTAEGPHGEPAAAPRSRGGSMADIDGQGLAGEPGNLTIHVVEADGLLAVDKSGASDPYVKVKVAGETVLKTKKIKDTLTPRWDEATTVNGLSGHPLFLNFSVKDHNTIGSDKDLADCEISVWDHIQPSAGQLKADFWAPLGGSGGRLHIALEFQPSDGQSSEGSSRERRRSIFGRK